MVNRKRNLALHYSLCVPTVARNFLLHKVNCGGMIELQFLHIFIMKLKDSAVCITAFYVMLYYHLVLNAVKLF